MRYPQARTGGSEQADHVYVRLEEARLRCEKLAAQTATEDECSSLRQLHRELGMAGWLASTEIDSNQRLWLLDTARRRSRLQVWDVRASHALAAAMILAEDALAHALTTENLPSDHMHLAHLHLLHAEELLHAHLEAESAQPAG